MNGKRSTTLTALVALSLLAGCATVTKEQTGAVVGEAAGAVIGAQIGEGSGREIAIALGAVAGSMIGASVGRHMDEQDRINTAVVLEKNRTGETSTWQNPDTRNHYTVTPTRTYEATGQGPCREFTMDAEIGGDTQQVYGTACRQLGHDQLASDFWPKRQRSRYASIGVRFCGRIHEPSYDKSLNTHMNHESRSCRLLCL